VYPSAQPPTVLKIETSESVTASDEQRRRSLRGHE
jgi:hypothetical protein